MPCSYCNAEFKITRWKSLCKQCTKKYCSQCCTDNVCKSCRNVLATKFGRSKLMDLKVKDLRLYLLNRNQPTGDCKEKHELVKLIQTFHGVYEPDLGNHTQTYDTSFNTHLGEECSATQPTNLDFSSSSAASSNSVPHVRPPSYQQTQDAFPSSAPYRTSIPTTEELGSRLNNANFSGNFQPTTSSNEQKSPASASSPKQHTEKEFPDITDIHSADELNLLSVKQLKFILRNNFVNFQGVLEKKDLIAKANTLFFQQKKDADSVKTDSAQGDAAEPIGENFCKICWDNPINCVFLECGHMMTCIDCSKQVAECPVCRQNIVRKVRVFKS